MKKINLLRIFIVLASIAALAACSAKSGEVALQPSPVEKEGIGPFNIEFAQDETYHKTVSADILQNEGKVEFLSYSDLPFQIIVSDIKTEISGCDAAQVKFDLFWIPNVDNAPTMGSSLQKNSRIQVYAKAKSALVASFKNLENCSHIDIDLSLMRIPFPQATYSSWISNYVSSTDAYHVMRLDVSQLATSVQGVFQITCDNYNIEKFTTEMTQNNESTFPKTMIFKINRVDTVATTTCAKQLGVKASDVGRLVYCIHNKASATSVFNLSCRLATGSQTYPASYTELSTSWQKNY
jgi:hypothetical protein